MRSQPSRKPAELPRHRCAAGRPESRGRAQRHHLPLASRARHRWPCRRVAAYIDSGYGQFVQPANTANHAARGQFAEVERERMILRAEPPRPPRSRRPRGDRGLESRFSTSRPLRSVAAFGKCRAEREQPLIRFRRGLVRAAASSWKDVRAGGMVTCNEPKAEVQHLVHRFGDLEQEFPVLHFELRRFDLHRLSGRGHESNRPGRLFERRRRGSRWTNANFSPPSWREQRGRGLLAVRLAQLEHRGWRGDAEFRLNHGLGHRTRTITAAPQRCWLAVGSRRLPQPGGSRRRSAPAAHIALPGATIHAPMPPALAS